MAAVSCSVDISMSNFVKKITFYLQISGLFIAYFLLYEGQCLTVSMNVYIYIYIVLWKRAPQQMLQTHRSLKTYCATL
jgi:hypothetical protein